MTDSIATYRRRLSVFCLREPDSMSTGNERQYKLKHALGHLLDEERKDEAYALLSAPWIARHFLETGSYRLLVDQFGDLATSLISHDSDADRRPLVVPLIGARETVRDLIAALPSDLLVA